MLKANRRGSDFRATNGELVKVSSLDGGAIRLEDGRTLPANYHEFTPVMRSLPIEARAKR